MTEQWNRELGVKNDVKIIAHKAKRDCDLVPDHLSRSADVACRDIGKAIEVLQMLLIHKIQEKLVLRRSS